MNVTITEGMKDRIVLEIGRLSFMLYEGLQPEHVSPVGAIINHLAAVLAGNLSIDGFHEEIAEAGEKTREYYYELLFEEK